MLTSEHSLIIYEELLKIATPKPEEPTKEPEVEAVETQEPVLTDHPKSVDPTSKERKEESEDSNKNGIVSFLEKIFGNPKEEHKSSKEKQDALTTTTVTTTAIETTKVRLPKYKTTSGEQLDKPGSVDSNIFVNSPKLVLKYLALDKDSHEYQQALNFALGEMSKSLIR